MSISLTVFQGRAGDRNDLAIPGALAVAGTLAERLSLPLNVIGQPLPALNLDWKTELAAAETGLRELAVHLRNEFDNERLIITILNRCAASIATLPVVVDSHPEACVVWFDAHADLNTPESSNSGYLGGLALSGPAGLWDSGFGSGLTLSNIVLVGARDLDPFEEELVRSGKVRLVHADDPNLVSSVMAAVAGRPVYIHFDCDVLEPGQVATEFEVPGGLSLATIREVFSMLASGPVLGLEVAEFQSSRDSAIDTACATALIEAIGPLLAAISCDQASLV